METSERKWTDYTDEEKLLVIDGYLDGVVALDDENENANKQRIEWIRAHIPAYKVNEGKNYIFVSYSHLDYKEVYKDLAAFSYNSQRRVRFWYDEGLPIGQDWEKAAGELIKNPHCVGVLFYLSKNLLLSPSVFKEIEYVKKLNKPYCTIALNDGLYSAGKIFDKAMYGELRGVAKYQDNLEAFFPDNDTALSYSRDNVLFRIDKIADAFDVTEEVFSDFVCEECDGGLNLVAYRGNKTEVHIPERIGDKNIAKITANFPHTVKIYIPKTIVEFNRNVFDSAVNLEKIIVDKANPIYYDINGVLCMKDYKWKDRKGNAIIRVPVCWNWVKQFKNYRPPKTNAPLDLYDQLTSIIRVIESKTGIEQSEVVKALDELLFVRIFLSINDRAYKDKYLGEFENLFSFMAYYFKRFSKEDIFAFCDAVIYKDTRKLYSFLQKLKKFSVFKNISFVAMAAFKNCRKTDYLFLPDSIDVIGCVAFEKSSLKLIFLPLGLREIFGGTFRDCIGLVSVLTETDYYRTHDEETFDKAVLFGNLERVTGGFENTGISGVVFKEGIGLRSCNFAKCNWLWGITVPGDTDALCNAFTLCIRLRRVFLEDGIEILANFCFAECISLKCIRIPESVRFIGETCFVGCEDLYEIEYGGTVEKWYALEEAERHPLYEAENKTTLIKSAWGLRESAWKSQGKGVRIICSDGVIEPSFED